MKKITTREDYFKEKRTFVNVHLLLLIVRLIGIVMYALLITFIVLYSVYPSILDNVSFSFKDITSVTKVIYPTLTFIWVILGVIYRVYRSAMRFYKKELNIIDEV